MSAEKVYRCDVCEKPRGATNHWFVAWVTKKGISIRTWEWAQAEHQLDAARVKHLCGQQCAHALLDQFLTLTASDKSE